SLPRDRAAVDDDDDRSWRRIDRPQLSPGPMGPRRTRRPFCLVVKQSCAILLQLPEPSHPAFLGFEFAAKGTCFRVEPAALKRPRKRFASGGFSATFRVPVPLWRKPPGSTATNASAQRSRN